MKTYNRQSVEFDASILDVKTIESQFVISNAEQLLSFSFNRIPFGSKEPRDANVI